MKHPDNYMSTFEDKQVRVRLWYIDSKVDAVITSKTKERDNNLIFGGIELNKLIEKANRKTRI